jgi:hypothetical protein
MDNTRPWRTRGDNFYNIWYHAASVRRGLLYAWGAILGLTIHFDKAVPEALEQWLGSEARYIIGAFGKVYDLEKIYGDKTNAIINECKEHGEKVVGGITMILDEGLRKLEVASVRLQNGYSFLLDEKYRLVEDAEKQKLVDALIKEDGPRVFPVNNK